MTGDLTRLSAELDELARGPAPPMRLDIAQAREVGRRTLSRRRTFGWLGSAIAVALVGGVTSVVIPRLTDTASPAVNSTANHPLIAHATFGWLPDWFAGVSYGAGAHGDYAVARGTGELPPFMWLKVSQDEPPAGFTGSGGIERTKVPAEPVNGRRAYWIAADARDPTNGGDTILRWQVPRGMWAELHAYYLPVNDSRETLLRVAADVAVADRPIPTPLRITNLPADFLLDEVMLNRPMLSGGGAWEFQLLYRVNGQPVTVGANPAGTGVSKSDNTTCTNTNGIDLCVSLLPETTGPPAGLTAIGGPQGLLDRITVLGMDERNWTTRLHG